MFASANLFSSSVSRVAIFCSLVLFLDFLKVLSLLRFSSAYKTCLMASSLAILFILSALIFLSSIVTISSAKSLSSLSIESRDNNTVKSLAAILERIGSLANSLYIESALSNALLKDSPVNIDKYLACSYAVYFKYSSWYSLVPGLKSLGLNLLGLLFLFLVYLSSKLSISTIMFSNLCLTLPDLASDLGTLGNACKSSSSVSCNKSLS